MKGLKVSVEDGGRVSAGDAAPGIPSDKVLVDPAWEGRRRVLRGLRAVGVEPVEAILSLDWGSGQELVSLAREISVEDSSNWLTGVGRVLLSRGDPGLAQEAEKALSAEHGVHPLSLLAFARNHLEARELSSLMGEMSPVGIAFEDAFSAFGPHGVWLNLSVLKMVSGGGGEISLDGRVVLKSLIGHGAQNLVLNCSEMEAMGSLHFDGISSLELRGLSRVSGTVTTSRSTDVKLPSLVSIGRGLFAERSTRFEAVRLEWIGTESWMGRAESGADICHADGLQLPALKSVVGDMIATGVKGLRLPSLEAVGNVLQMDDVEDARFEKLTRVGSDLFLNDASNVHFPSLVRVEGVLDSRGSRKIGMPRLEWVEGYPYTGGVGESPGF